MIVVYAGRRIDPDDPAAARRFPLASVPLVQEELTAVLGRLQPTTVIGSAACGSDLLVLEAAGERRIERRVILPYDRVTFRRTSVTDRPGDWGKRYDAVVAEVSAAGNLVELTLDPATSGTYQHANAEIFNQAERLARAAGEHTSALVIWDGKTRGAGDVTEWFLKEARRREWPTTEILTTERTSTPGRS
jgi:Ni,Fe-hydrogenase III large subunit